MEVSLHSLQENKNSINSVDYNTNRLAAQLAESPDDVNEATTVLPQDKCTLLSVHPVGWILRYHSSPEMDVQFTVMTAFQLSDRPTDNDV